MKLRQSLELFLFSGVMGQMNESDKERILQISD